MDGGKTSDMHMGGGGTSDMHMGGGGTPKKPAKLTAVGVGERGYKNGGAAGHALSRTSATNESAQDYPTMTPSKRSKRIQTRKGKVQELS